MKNSSADASSAAEGMMARATRIAYFLGLAGTLAFALARGARPGLGFLLGAALSVLNLRWWGRLVDSLGRGAGDPAHVPARASAAQLIRRFVFACAVVYVIVKVLGTALAAVLAGLFVTAAAVILDILYEAIFRR